MQYLMKPMSYVLFIVLGFLLKRAGLFGKDDHRLISRILIHVTLPCTIVRAFSDVSPDMQMFMIVGIGFLLAMDALLPHFTPESFHCRAGHTSRRRTALLVLAVTLHNIPEGMAVGISFALAAHNGDPSLLTAAAALALGIGIQNFPEGAAIALPLRQEGMSRRRAFAMGALSGVVEPVFGLLTVLAVGSIQPLMPWLLSFAAGAMLYVVVEELIPEANLCRGGHSGTLGVMAGFLIMMILDVALG